MRRWLTVLAEAITWPAFLIIVGALFILLGECMNSGLQP